MQPALEAGGSYAGILSTVYLLLSLHLFVLLQVNPDIRGGLIVEIGDRTIDLSVSAKMARMNKLLKDTL